MQKKTKKKLSLLVGSGCLVLFLLAIALVAYSNHRWEKFKQSDEYATFSEKAEEAVAGMQKMMELRESLFALYPAQEIKVMNKTQTINGRSKKILAVSFINPQFTLSEDDQARTQEMKEIALYVAENYAGADRYDEVGITISSQKKRTGVTVFNNKNHNFPVPALFAEITANRAAEAKQSMIPVAASEVATE